LLDEPVIEAADARLSPEQHEVFGGQLQWTGMSPPLQQLAEFRHGMKPCLLLMNAGPNLLG
jgi:hypothetical protein